MKWSCFLFLIGILPGRSLGQVNPQTGAAQANIPLYSYSDPGNRLSLNASLVYVDGSGLRVSEMASAVGTGWTLDCGGSITRIQHGEPDDQKMNNPPSFTAQNYINYAPTYFPDGYLYTSYLPSQQVTNDAAYAPYKQKLPLTVFDYKPPPDVLADREQDVFAFSFNGRSGEFIIGKNRQVVTLPDSKLKISLQETDMSSSNIRTRISQFTITDESGIQYLFKDLELANVCLYSEARCMFDETSSQNIDNLTPNDISVISGNRSSVNVILGNPNGQFVVNKWYLSQITNPLTGRQITFTYNSYNEDIKADKSIQVSSTTNNSGPINVLWQRNKFTGKRLSSVILSNSERLDFLYSSSPRIDVPNENTLDQVQVSYNSQPVYSWLLGYGYFVGNEWTIKSPTATFTTAEKNWSRLCLLTLQKKGLNNTTEPPYTFAYNMGGTDNEDVIPPMYSIYQDQFGYYNEGRYSIDPVEGFETAFYPGQILRAWVNNSHNTYRLPASIVAQNGIIKSITYPLGGSLSFAYEANSSPQIPLGGVRVRTTSLYDGISHSNDIIKQYNYVNADEITSSGWGSETAVYSSSKSVTADGCTSAENPSVYLKDAASNFLSDNSFFLSQAGAEGTTAFGAFGEAFLWADVSSFIVGFIQNINGPPTSTFQVTEHSTLSTSYNNPLPWGYARTEVVSLLSTDNIGKIVYEFSNPNGAGDRAIDVPTLTVANSNRPRCAPWTYGLPKIVTTYDKNNKIVKQNVNHYNYIVNNLSDDNFLCRSWSTTAMEYGCDISIFVSNTSSINQESYYPLTGHSELTSSDELVYNNAQQFFTTTTNYEYDINFQLKHKFSNNSKGEKIETFYYHPYDYSAATGAIGTMNNGNSNILSPTLSTETYINKSDGNKYMIGATSTDFDIFQNSDIKPKVSYSFQNTTPLLSSMLQPFNTEDVLRDPGYFKQVAFFDYDNNGNLVQTVTGGNKIQSSIYDYDNRLLVATVQNASFNDIGYTSFEAEGGKPGSWLNTAAIITDDARTGNKCFNLSDLSNVVAKYFGFSGMNNSLNYIVSFWSKNGTPCINGFANGQATITTCAGSSGWKTGATVNGWTYYEIQVNNIDKIGAGGTGLIDEFRVFPVGAQMTSTTYIPLIGKTSECDASGRVTYYLYDDLGRLVKISDDQRNVIRTYEYNYKQ